MGELRCVCGQRVLYGYFQDVQLLRILECYDVCHARMR